MAAIGHRQCGNRIHSPVPATWNRTILLLDGHRSRKSRRQRPCFLSACPMVGPACLKSLHSSVCPDLLPGHPRLYQDVIVGAFHLALSDRTLVSLRPSPHADPGQIIQCEAWPSRPSSSLGPTSGCFEARVRWRRIALPQSCMRVPPNFWQWVGLMSE